MAKLYVYYGAMNSAKSSNLLMNVHNYEDQNKRVLLLKPSFDTRSKQGVIDSRDGLSHECMSFSKDESIVNIMLPKLLNDEHFDCIFVDECHFMTRHQAVELSVIVDYYDINVICYGLKNSYVDGKIFDAMQELMYQCNSMYEIKSCCRYCNSKATHHIRLVNGKVIRDGDVEIVGDVKDLDEKYISVCRKHYYSPPSEIYKRG